MKNTFSKALVLSALFGLSAMGQDSFKSHENDWNTPAEEQPLTRHDNSPDEQLDLATGRRFKRVSTVEWQRVYDSQVHGYRFVQVAVEKWIPLENPPQPKFDTFFVHELGATLRQFSEHGFEVVHVEFGSLAERINLTAGDRLSKVNGERVLSIGQLKSAFSMTFELEFFRPSSSTHHWAKHTKFGPGFFND